MTVPSSWPSWWPASRNRASACPVVIFADPDSGLLEHQAHPCGPVCDALKVLADRDIPLVLCSSRTRAELELIQHEFQFRHPFVSENGGAVYVPRGYFSSSHRLEEVPGYDVVAFGKSHPHVVEVLRTTAETLAIEVRSFSAMSVQEVAEECGLSLAEARLAQLREYGEPFRILESDLAVQSRLLNALRRAGLRSVNGGRFHHVSAGADMRRSIRTLTSQYQQRSGTIFTVGVSPGLADTSLLCDVDLPIIVRNHETDPSRVLRKVPTAHVTGTTGSLGWVEAILFAIEPDLQTARGRRS